MKQKANRSVSSLINAGTKLSAGANTHATNLGLVLGTKALIDTDVDALSVAHTTVLNGQSVLRTKWKEREQKAETSYGVAVSIRDALKRTIGRQYSSAWEGTGFSRSLMVPRSVHGLQHLLLSLKKFLTDYPTLEVAGLATATIAGDALEALTTADTAVTLQRGVLRTARTERRKKEKAMRNRIRWVVEELKRVVGDVGGVWDAFGLNQPGLKQIPAKPQNVTVVLIGNHAASVKWDKAARAEYYRVWVKFIGTDQEAEPVGSPADLDFTIENLTPNTQFASCLKKKVTGRAGWLRS
ncbi:MAG: fibronectin type III domain-containing protein [Limisphaerales bacterium]